MTQCHPRDQPYKSSTSRRRTARIGRPSPNRSPKGSGKRRRPPRWPPGMMTADQVRPRRRWRSSVEIIAGVSHDASCVHAGREGGPTSPACSPEPAAARAGTSTTLLAQSAAGRIVTSRLANRYSMCRARMHTAPPRYAIGPGSHPSPLDTRASPSLPASTRHSRSPTPRAAPPAPGQPQPALPCSIARAASRPAKHGAGSRSPFRWPLAL